MKAKCPIRQTSDKSDAALLVDAKAAAETNADMSYLQHSLTLKSLNQ